MSRFARTALCAVVIASACSLGACAALGITPAVAQLDAAKLLYLADAGVDFGATSITTALQTGVLKGSTASTVHTDLQTADTVLLAARQSYAAANTADVVAKAAQVAAVIGEIQSLAKPETPTSSATAATAPTAASDVETILLGALVDYAADSGLISNAKAVLAAPDLATVQAAIAVQEPTTDADVAACLAAFNAAPS